MEVTINRLFYFDPLPFVDERVLFVLTVNSDRI